MQQPPPPPRDDGRTINVICRAQACGATLQVRGGKDVQDWARALLLLPSASGGGRGCQHTHLH